MKAVFHGAHGALLRAIRQILREDPLLGQLAGLGVEDREIPAIRIEGLASHSWSSATFNGQRHQLELRLEGVGDMIAEASERLAERLRDAEFDLPGHVLADIALADMTTRQADCGTKDICQMRFEALTVEE